MNPKFIAKPPQPVKWGSITKHLGQIFRRLGFIIWQIVVPFKRRPEEIDPFPEPDPKFQVTESHVKQCQWIFDQAEERRVNLEQKAQSTFGLMVFLVPLLASLFVFIISRGTTSSTLIITLVLVGVSAFFLLLGFISAVRAVAVKETETLFLDSVLTEAGQFRKYDEAFSARGLLYCASMNTATNDHIAQFVKGAHILTAVAGLHDKGVKAFEQDKPEEAEKLLREAVTDDAKYAVAFNDLGVVLMREHKYADAEQVFRKGLQADPESVALLQNLGTDLVHAGKYLDAIEPLKQALRLQPNRGEAHLQLGAALVETGQYAEAEQELLAAQSDKGADEAGLQLYFGKLYASTGNYAKSIAAFKEFLNLAPADSPSRPAIQTAIDRMQQEMAKGSGH